MDYSPLRERAEQLLRVLQRQARRPYVVELTGTPKAGKTTSLNVLQSFFKACGYRVQLQKERAADCPLPMKGHFFFNAWTTATMLAEVLAAIETNVDLILLDRAFFDALIWLELQHRRGQVSDEESQRFTDFVLLERWRSLVDVTILMTATPGVALKRENQNAIVPRTGSIMNVDALGDFNDVLRAVRDRFIDKFSFIEIDSSQANDVVSLNAHIAGRLLDNIEDWADPPIAVVDRSTIQGLFGERVLIPAADAVSIWESIERAAKPVKRSVAEEDPNLVQLVSCGICVSQGSALVLQRSTEDEKADSYGRYVLWKGCHLEMRASVSPSIALAGASLLSRLENDLHLKKIPTPELVGLVWDPNVRSESRHLGFISKLSISDEAIIKSLRIKEFRKSGRGHKLVGKLADKATLLADLDKFEPWSKALLEAGMIP